MVAPTNLSPRVLPRGVRRALDAMRANLEREWNLKELADVAGVSSRTLQRQFRLFFGKAPRAALGDIRFEAARRELLQSRPDARVMDIALRCGLPHLGRFATAYRRRYGETPSQTLKRQELFADAIEAAPAIVVSGIDRPSVMLEPIETGAENIELARSIADELAAALTRAGIDVCGRASARYRLTGVMRGAGREARLTFRLMESETGRHLSAHRSDALDDETALEPLATRIAAAFQPCLRLAEIDRAQRKPDGELNSHDLTLRAMPGVLSLDADGNARALDLLERARDRNPDDALATALAAWARMQRVVYHFSATPQDDRVRSADLALRVRALAADATVLAVLGNALALLHDVDAADFIIRKALALDGGSSWAWSRSAWIDLYKGETESAIERFKIALDLAPYDLLAFNNLVGIGCAYFEAGNYAESARWQEQGLIAHPSAVWVHRTMCPAYVLAGNRSEARRSLEALQRQYPELTVAAVRQNLPPLSESYRDRILEGLQHAGLPA